MGGVVTAVSYSAGHTLVKQNRNSIRLLAGLGVEGDAHLGATVKHARGWRASRKSQIYVKCT